MRGAFWKVVGIAALGLAASAPGRGAGFGIFEQGSKAMGMAGAFTAQADDPSALFHNAGGVAFFTRREIATGFTWIRSVEADFEGAAPFPGPGVREEQETLSEFPPHLYWVQPINHTWKFGLGINSPFGLATEWADPAEFSGRFLSTRAELRAVDVNPTIGWQLTPNFGLGFGAVARFSDVQLARRVPAINPFTQRVSDIGALELESDFGEGFGWNAGLLHRVGSSFSWGLAYRSGIDVDYEGDARLTQIATGTPFDPIIAARLPFDRDLPVATALEFPDMASLGLAFALSPNLLLETDVNRTGWSSVETIVIDFTGGDLPDATIPEEWEDANNYRAGLRWTLSPATQLRFGYVFDETPQPEPAVSPLLPDSDRHGVTFGWGHTGGFDFDLAVMYLTFDERERDESFDEEGNDFFGTYNQKAWLFGLTVNW
ncbi:MAG TPA: outer membrane protein transport protein [Thermoanaerobaculia bacterium]|nr:outer membrane protein transport protein [Thermoanaerobaculia bacterium]